MLKNFIDNTEYLPIWDDYRENKDSIARVITYFVIKTVFIEKV